MRAAVGEAFPLLFDGGVRSGEDVLRAIALGANGVMIGRLQACALAVGGALGVGHMIKLLRDTKGATAIEYGLIAALIAVAAITAMQSLGNNLSGTFNKVSSNMTA